MFIIRLLSRLPFWFLYGLSDFLFFVSYRVVRYRRKMVWKNLKNSFPEKSDDELRIVERDFYKNLCDYGVETLKLVTISAEELSRRMVYKDNGPVNEYAKNNQSVFFLASHNFNWEWLIAAANLNLPIHADFVYQPQNNEFFNRLSLMSRSRFGSVGIRRDEVAREILKRKGTTCGIALVADQYPGYKKDKKHMARFLHQDTVFFYGANQLAVLMQFPVVFAHITKVKRGYYEVVLKHISKPPYDKDSNETVDNYIKAVENLIQENPSSWLWSHNRWKKRHLSE